MNSFSHALEQVYRDREDSLFCVELNPFDEEKGIGIEIHIFFEVSRNPSTGQPFEVSFHHARFIDGPSESLAVTSLPDSTIESFVSQAWKELEGG